MCEMCKPNVFGVEVGGRLESLLEIEVGGMRFYAESVDYEVDKAAASAQIFYVSKRGFAYLVAVCEVRYGFLIFCEKPA